MSILTKAILGGALYLSVSSLTFFIPAVFTPPAIAQNATVGNGASNIGGAPPSSVGTSPAGAGTVQPAPPSGAVSPPANPQPSVGAGPSNPSNNPANSGVLGVPGNTTPPLGTPATPNGCVGGTQVYGAGNCFGGTQLGTPNGGVNNNSGNSTVPPSGNVGGNTGTPGATGTQR